MGELGPRGCAGTLGGDISTTILESSLPEEHWPLPGKQRESNLYQALKQGTRLKKKEGKETSVLSEKKKSMLYVKVGIQGLGKGLHYYETHFESLEAQITGFLKDEIFIRRYLNNSNSFVIVKTIQLITQSSKVTT